MDTLPDFAARQGWDREYPTFSDFDLPTYVGLPTFMNLPTYKATIVGYTVTDATIILAAIDPCYCCTERVAAVDRRGRRMFDGADLLRLSREKTELIRRRLGCR